ncbi:testis-expressed protein 9 [Phymastichus coffea]|uniref:testis-expressed protein 9 n=1 Tax=Phymastichus coffea TaxID=108790 RepID=UPI00273AEB18|nr:testis-expressed protein 9 [Phymastichus coffea]
MMKNNESYIRRTAVPDVTLKYDEPHFTELNKVLEDRVNNLMADVDAILHKQINIIRFPKQHHNQKQYVVASHVKTDSAEKLRQNNSVNEVTSFNFAAKEVNDDCQNDQIAWIGGNGNNIQTLQCQTTTTKTTSASIIRFLRGQITKLQTDLQAIQYEKKKMEGQCKYLEAQIRKKEENDEKIRHQLNCYKDSILKIESANSDLCIKMQAQTIQIISSEKEIENLKTKLISLSQTSTNIGLKLNRTLEENDKLRSSLKISQNEEKEAREYIRKIQEDKRLALKASEKQRTELFQAFKKQMQLISNLKKQKLYMETNKQIQLLEKEFEKILECKVI